MKIYTKAGDKGLTSLFGGTRLSKDDIRIEAYGTVDELNAQIGLLQSMIKTDSFSFILKSIQEGLFLIGSHLASDGSLDDKLPSLVQLDEIALETSMDAQSSELTPLRAFILPGGSAGAAQAHVCRTICRRAERRAVSLSQEQDVNPQIILYLNRLSDFFFIVARSINHQEGIDDIEWVSR
ncbi:UNVERIFIED_CONTAM: hypothetical protein GTU68_040768 [Idotea baltica]|nr:hypothetical protein [Idotea baltica]